MIKDKASFKSTIKKIVNAITLYVNKIYCNFLYMIVSIVLILSAKILKHIVNVKKIDNNRLEALDYIILFDKCDIDTEAYDNYIKIKHEERKIYGDDDGLFRRIDSQ